MNSASLSPTDIVGSGEQSNLTEAKHERLQVTTRSEFEQSLTAKNVRRHYAVILRASLCRIAASTTIAAVDIDAGANGCTCANTADGKSSALPMGADGEHQISRSIGGDCKFDR